jgi:hypothetical protein
MRRPFGGAAGEEGQAVPFGLALAGFAVVLTMAVGRLAGDVVDAARARRAADAAALAGVAGGRIAAERLAAANGAVVLEWGRQDHEVTVTVRVGDAHATARASDGP